MAKVKKRRFSAHAKEKILLYLNASFSIVTIIMGFLTMLVTEKDLASYVLYVSLIVASIIAIIEEINTMVFRKNKETTVSSLPCIGLYLCVIILPLCFTSFDLAIIMAIFASLYISIRIGKIIYLVVRAHDSKWILKTIVLGALIAISITFLILNIKNPIDTNYYVGLFYVVESLIIVFMSVFSAASAKRFIRILIRTHTAEVLFGLIFLTLVSALILTLVEDATFPTLGDALWYCFATITTIGFGDFSARTFAGRIITVLLGIYGIGVVALITSIIVNLYSEGQQQRLEGEEKENVQLQKRIQELEAKLNEQNSEPAIENEPVEEPAETKDEPVEEPVVEEAKED